ncbi:unnamed protein product [Acanthoscelides obtectus]|nr:unnamed protein product [Acanthoscelides obtectus]CAK1640573.1 hypothetical protein AOBTE_LOCUS11810 [Acanthoscelides obtectus]
MDLPLLKIPLLSVFGNGTLRIVVSDVNIAFKVDILGMGTGEAIETLDLTIKDFSFAVTGVFDDVELSKEISDVINKNTTKVLNTYMNKVSHFIKTVLNKIIDIIISNLISLPISEDAESFSEIEYELIVHEALNHVFTSLV